MSDRRPGNPFRDLPLPAFFFVVAGLWVALQLIFKFGRVDLITIVSTVVGGLLFSAVLTAIVAANRRRLGGARQATALRKKWQVVRIFAETTSSKGPRKIAECRTHMR